MKRESYERRKSEREEAVWRREMKYYSKSEEKSFREGKS